MIDPIKEKNKYINPLTNFRAKRNFFDFFLWIIGYYDNVSEHLNMPDDFKYPLHRKEFITENPSISWINHSTFLISWNNLNILTDPIWNDKCSPVSFAGPKRRHPPGISLNNLPQIQYVLISHNHYDHLDKNTVLTLKERYPLIRWIVPKGLKKWFLKRGITNVFEMSWFEELYFENHNIRIHFTPAQHFSGRGLFDSNKTLWGGFVVEYANKKFYFAGDTGYNETYFKKIGEKYKNIDLSLIPIGAYLPRKFMHPVHISPQEAVKIHQDIGSNFSIGMHFKTFHLSDEHIDIPPFELFLALQNANINPKNFLVLEPGEKVNW